MGIKSSEENKNLIAICKRIDKLEKSISERGFIEKMVNSIADIFLCENCGKGIGARIGGVKWFKKGFFQCGGDKNRIFSWCSKKCFNLYGKRKEN